MNSESSVFEAIRRGYTNLESSSPQEICEYFSSQDPVALTGHINNIKGIVFEQEIVDALNDNGIKAMLFAETNHPNSDIFVLDDSEVIAEYQLKATDSIQYISSTLEECSDIPIIATTEVASEFSDANVLDSGLSNEDLTNFVSDVLSAGTVDPTADYLSDDLNEELIDTIVDMVGIGFPIPSPLWLLGLLL